jgi:hypothetical protein
MDSESDPGERLVSRAADEAELARMESDLRTLSSADEQTINQHRDTLRQMLREHGVHFQMALAFTAVECSVAAWRAEH